MITFTETVELIKEDCGKCGGIFAITKAYYDRSFANGQRFNCPYCGISLGWNETEADRLKKQLEQAQNLLRSQKCETLAEQNRRIVAESGKEKAEKKLRRVKNGVCPCCQRSFSDLQRHMATKHPKI